MLTGSINCHLRLYCGTFAMWYVPCHTGAPGADGPRRGDARVMVYREHGVRCPACTD